MILAIMDSAILFCLFVVEIFLSGVALGLIIAQHCFRAERPRMLFEILNGGKTNGRKN